MGRPTTKGRGESQDSRKGQAQDQGTFTVSDAVRVINAKVDEIKEDRSSDIDRQVYVKHLEAGDLEKASAHADEKGIDAEERKELAEQPIRDLVADGDTDTAAKIAAEVGHDEDSLQDLLSDSDMEEGIVDNAAEEMVDAAPDTASLRTGE